MFLNSRDAWMRLSNSVVRLNGEPIYIVEVRDKSSAHYYTIGPKGTGDDLKVVNFDDPGFDPSSIPLGYFISESRAVYLQRMPTRRYKQGVSSGSVQVKNNRGTGSSRVQRLLTGSGMYRCIHNDYPTLESCVSNVSKFDLKSVPFDKQWAYGRSGAVYYKAQEVGYYEKGSIVLNDQYKYLTEVLEELGHG